MKNIAVTPYGLRGIKQVEKFGLNRKTDSGVRIIGRCLFDDNFWKKQRMFINTEYIPRGIVRMRTILTSGPNDGDPVKLLHDLKEAADDYPNSNLGSRYRTLVALNVNEITEIDIIRLNFYLHVKSSHSLDDIAQWLLVTSPFCNLFELNSDNQRETNPFKAKVLDKSIKEKTQQQVESSTISINEEQDIVITFDDPTESHSDPSLYIKFMEASLNTILKLMGYQEQGSQESQQSDPLTFT